MCISFCNMDHSSSWFCRCNISIQQQKTVPIKIVHFSFALFSLSHFFLFFFWIHCNFHIACVDITHIYSFQSLLNLPITFHSIFKISKPNSKSIRRARDKHINFKTNEHCAKYSNLLIVVMLLQCAIYV